MEDTLEFQMSPPLSVPAFWMCFVCVSECVCPQSTQKSCICNITAFCICAGKNHVCKFIGCGRNDKFNYVVMQLQVQYFFFFCFICVWKKPQMILSFCREGISLISGGVSLEGRSVWARLYGWGNRSWSPLKPFTLWASCTETLNLYGPLLASLLFPNPLIWLLSADAGLSFILSLILPWADCRLPVGSVTCWTLVWHDSTLIQLGRCGR